MADMTQAARAPDEWDEAASQMEAAQAAARPDGDLDNALQWLDDRRWLICLPAERAMRAMIAELRTLRAEARARAAVQ